MSDARQSGNSNVTTTPAAYVVPVVDTDFNSPWEGGEHWALIRWPVEVGERVRLDDDGTYCYGHVTRWADWGPPGRYAYVKREDDTWHYDEPRED